MNSLKTMRRKLARRVDCSRSVAMTSMWPSAAWLSLLSLLILFFSSETSAAETKYVGVTYSNWFSTTDVVPNYITWGGSGDEVIGSKAWGEPLLGYYSSKDLAVIDQHAEWMADAGVDFVMLDLSNSGFHPLNPPSYSTSGFPPDRFWVEDSAVLFTDRMAWRKSQGLPYVKVAMMIGALGDCANVTNGYLDKGADIVNAWFINNSQRNSVYFRYKGKPLLTTAIIGCAVYFPSGGGGWGWGDRPLVPFDRNDFTVRHINHNNALAELWDPQTQQSHKRLWSWEERYLPNSAPPVIPSYMADNGVPEFQVILAGTRGDGHWTGPNGRGRENGQTFKDYWALARARNVNLAMVQSWNEWTSPGEQYNAEYSNDIEPSDAHGTFYLDLMKQEIAKFKGISVTPDPTPAPTLTRYIQINGGEWLPQGSATLCAGGTVSFAPHPMEENWQWTGPEGFSANIREVTFSNITTGQAGNYVATYTANGSSNSVTYSVKVHSLPQASVGITNASDDQNNGTITLAFPDTAGRSNISFSINGNQTYTTVADNSGSYTFSNLGPGGYEVWSRWGNGDCPVKLGDHQLIREASDFEGDASYDFDDGTFQGWIELTAANSNSGPRNWALSPSAFLGGTHSGAGAIGQNIEGEGNQDSSHPTLWLRSPEFVLNGSGALRVWLFGGAGSGSLTGVPVGSVPAQSSEPGFQGVALRNANTEMFVLTGSKNISGDNWEQIVFTASELAALDQDALYTLDLIDAGHGGWGWVAMDSVTIPGEISGEEPPPPPPSGPTISSISGQTIFVNTDTGALSFTVGSEEVDPGSLTLSGSSSNTTLVSNGNIVFGGSGAERTVTVTPSAAQTGSATITVTVSDAARTASTEFVVTVVSGALPVEFDFAAHALSGWIEASTDGQGRQFFAVVPPSLNSPNLTPHSGEHFIGLHNPSFDLDAGYTQNSEHDTLILSSPEFMLDGSGNLTVWLAGGGSAGVSLAGTNVTSLPTASSAGGFLGVALRNVTTGTFVLSASKMSGGNEWEEVSFTAVQLAALPQEDGYTLDLIDARHGGWGWVNMDTVTIPGTLEEDSMPPALPRLTIQGSGENQVRLSWPSAAEGWALQSSTDLDGAFSDADLEVTVEGDENAAYDQILSPKQFYRLTQ